MENTSDMAALLSSVIRETIRAYDRLIAANKVETKEQFRQYCKTYGLDFDQEMQQARNRLGF